MKKFKSYEELPPIYIDLHDYIENFMELCDQCFMEDLRIIPVLNLNDILGGINDDNRTPF